MLTYCKRFLIGISASVLVLSSLTGQAQTNSPKKKILFFSKSSGFEHSVIHLTNGVTYVEPILKQLGEQNNIEFTFSKDGSLFTPENIGKYDGFFFYTTGDLTTAGTDKNPAMSVEGKAAFLKAIENGKAFIGTHSASDTFHSPGNAEHGAPRFVNDGEGADPYIKMIGAEFIKHGAQQPSMMKVVDPNFPGMSSLGDGFKMKEEWYSLKDFAPDMHVLLVQETGDMKGNEYARPPYPATWIRNYGKGRVFYTNMGHREDVWTNPIFVNVLTNGMNWALGRFEADLKPNISSVTPLASQLPAFVPDPPKKPAPAKDPAPVK
ncbi:MAG: hypothetical protein JWN25_897 [Verrucomicrobiales bacterium]|nr:hypothetical protein [Verrucomicrobiales bacterium]